MTGHEDQFKQGASFEDITGDRRLEVLDAAVDYRGDVTIMLDDATTMTGFGFDLTSDEPRCFRLICPEDSNPVSIHVDRIHGLSFSGKDTAAGKTWENWVKWYAEKKLAGEEASIESESLDQA